MDFDLNMLIGRMNHTLDSKGRVIIPSRFRSCLGDQVVITRGFNACLNIYSIEEWKKLVEKLSIIPASDQEGQKFVYYMLGNAEPCTLDKQGKVLVPAHLRNAAGLVKDVTLVGMGTRVELWDTETWDASSNYSDTREIVASVEKYGI